MSDRHKFRPQFVEGLEERKVLSQGGSVLSATAAAIAAQPGKSTKAQIPSIVGLVNTSFASFARDFSATRSVYFASIQARTAPIGSSVTTAGMSEPAGDLAAIQQYTQQRVNLLAQQLRNNFQQSSLYTKKDKHHNNNTDPLAVITKKINAEATSTPSKTPYDKGTLGKALFQATPSPTASPTAVALNALAQDNAIESARVAIINGINTLKVQASRHH